MINILKIKARMVECGLSQMDLAQEIGINPSTLSRKLNNKDGKYLTINEANTIIKVLNITEPREYFFN